MRKIRIVGGRNGRLWPEVLETAAEGRREGRPVILYVPEQLTLQTERDLITGLKLPGLLDTDVISPKTGAGEGRHRRPASHDCVRPFHGDPPGNDGMCR